MQPNLKTLLENLDTLEQDQFKQEIEVPGISLEQQLSEEWQQFQKVESITEQGMPVMAPSQAPIGTNPQKPKVDPRAVSTLTQIKAATKNPRIDVPGTANAMAKASAGQPLTRQEQIKMATFNQAVGGAAQQSILNPITAKQTINAIKTSQQAQRAAQIRAAQAKKKG